MSGEIFGQCRRSRSLVFQRPTCLHIWHLPVFSLYRFEVCSIDSSKTITCFPHVVNLKRWPDSSNSTLPVHYSEHNVMRLIDHGAAAGQGLLENKGTLGAAGRGSSLGSPFQERSTWHVLDGSRKLLVYLLAALVGWLFLWQLQFDSVILFYYPF